MKNLKTTLILATVVVELVKISREEGADGIFLPGYSLTR